MEEKQESNHKKSVWVSGFRSKRNGVCQLFVFLLYSSTLLFPCMLLPLV